MAGIRFSHQQDFARLIVVDIKGPSGRIVRDCVATGRWRRWRPTEIPGRSRSADTMGERAAATAPVPMMIIIVLIVIIIMLIKRHH
jgi:hypothetical protein